VAPTAGSTPPRATGGHYEAAYRTVAVDGDVAVATGIKRYGGRPGGPVVRKCRSCFVIRFDAEGRCRSFTEWYIARPLPERRSRSCRSPRRASL